VLCISLLLFALPIDAPVREPIESTSFEQSPELSRHVDIQLKLKQQHQSEASWLGALGGIALGVGAGYLTARFVDSSLSECGLIPSATPRLVGTTYCSIGVAFSAASAILTGAGIALLVKSITKLIDFEQNKLSLELELKQIESNWNPKRIQPSAVR
jgi:hypothetical protein